MRILFLTQNREDLVCLEMFHYLEQEVSKLTDCKWAGIGHVDFREESIDETVKRLYGSDPPDWVITSHYAGKEPYYWAERGMLKPEHRAYKIATITTDIHECHLLGVGPKGYVNELNRREYDAILMLYTQVGAQRKINRLRSFTKYFKNQERGMLKKEIKSVTRFRNKFLSKFTRSRSLEMEIRPISKTYYIDNLKSRIFHLAPWISPIRFRPISGPEKFDVILLGSTHYLQYPIRHAVKKGLPKLAAQKGWKYLVRDRPPGVSSTRKISDYEHSEYYAGDRYAEIMGSSKSTTFDSSIYKYPLVRYWEAMACKCLVLADTPLTAEDIHLRPGHNFVEVSVNNWGEKLEYYLENDSERERVIDRGYETVMKYHTAEIRARQLVDFLEENK